MAASVERRQFGDLRRGKIDLTPAPSPDQSQAPYERGEQSPYAETPPLLVRNERKGEGQGVRSIRNPFLAQECRQAGMPGDIGQRVVAFAVVDIRAASKRTITRLSVLERQSSSTFARYSFILSAVTLALGFGAR